MGVQISGQKEVMEDEDAVRKSFVNVFCQSQGCKTLHTATLFGINYSFVVVEVYK